MSEHWRFNLPIRKSGYLVRLNARQWLKNIADDIGGGFDHHRSIVSLNHLCFILSKANMVREATVLCQLGYLSLSRSHDPIVQCYAVATLDK